MRRAAIPSGIATIVVAGAALADVVGAPVGPRGGPLGLANLLAAHLAIAIRIRRPSAPRRPFACPSRTTRATATQPWRSSTRLADDLRGALPVLLLGDFNVAPTEPGYQVLAEGLEDVHRAVGLGPGWTWRPSRFEGLGLGLLRIDAVFTRGLDPLTIATDCSRPGDHCLVRAELAVP